MTAPRTAGWRRRLGLGLAVVVGLVFAAGLYLSARSLWLRAVSVRWPTAAGTVVSARVLVSLDQEGFSSRYPEITFRYTVDGDTYVGVENALKGDPEKVVAEHPPRSPVAVHYNSERPDQAFLVTGWPAIGLGGLLFPAAGAGLLGMISVALFRAMKSQPAQPR